MTHSKLLHRRAFLADAARVAVAGLLTLELDLLAACGRDTNGRLDRLEHLTTDEARTMGAFARQILPPDHDFPGADELGVVTFVDRACGMPFFADSVPVIRTGLADLDARAKTASGHQSFASAPNAEQIAILLQIQTTPFFATARTLVVIGTFADPSYGGNRGGAGWSLVGLEHRPSYTAPYGWYDATAHSGARTGTA